MKALRIPARLEFPLLRRELTALLRTRRAVILLILSIAVSSLLPMLSWPAERFGPSFWYSNIVTFNVFALTLLSAALLIIPAFTAGAISGEREANTYDLLYTTLLSPSSIIISKVLASTGYVLILLVGTCPLVCVLYLIGGLGFDTIARTYLLIFAAVIMSGLVCLSHSMRSPRTAQSAVKGYFWTAFWNFGLTLMLVAGLLLLHEFRAPGWRRAPVEEAMHLVSCLSPFMAITYEIQDPISGSGFGSGSLGIQVEPWLIFLVYAACIGAAQFIILLRHVRTPEVPASWLKRMARSTTKEKKAAPIRRCLSTRLLVAAGEADVPLLRNPVFLKEIRSEFFARRRFRWGLFWAPLVLYLLAAIGMLQSEDYAACVLTVGAITLGLVLLLVPGVTASCIPREIEQGNLDFLRGTLLSLREVATGKFLAGLHACAGLLGSMVVSMILAAIAAPHLPLPPWRTRSTTREDILCAGMAVGVVVVTYLSTTALALLAAAVSRRTLKALLLCYGSMVCAYILVPLLLVMGNLGRGNPDAAEAWTLATNPIGALVVGWNCIERGRISSDQGAILLFPWLHLGAAVVFWISAAWYLEEHRARDR